MRSGRRALALGLVHAAVDGACAFVLFRDVDVPGASLVAVIAWIVAYDALAFLLQLPMGLLADRLRADRALALAGLAAVLTALAGGAVAPGPAALLAALGNAVFHVGAGASVLRTSDGRAADIGYFVGPGATGLGLGIVLGRGEAPVRAALGLALLAGAWVVTRGVPLVKREARSSSPGLERSVRLGCALLLVTVAVRSLLGDTVASAWRGEAVAIALGLALASSAGKMLGGIVGDGLGWRATAGLSLALAGPLLALGQGAVGPALAGLLLVQATTPITLEALRGVLPHRPGLAFGLPSAVLVLGAAPGLLSVFFLRSAPLLLAAAWLSAAAVLAGLLLAAAPERGKMEDTR